MSELRMTRAFAAGLKARWAHLENEANEPFDPLHEHPRTTGDAA